MRLYWLVLVLLLASCAPPIAIPLQATSRVATARYTPMATLTPTAQNKKSTEIPVQPSWTAAAKTIRERAQQAIDETLWEDSTFKQETYTLCKYAITASTGKVQKDFEEALKRFRWGMEFMDRDQLKEVIKILDQYN